MSASAARGSSRLQHWAGAPLRLLRAPAVIIGDVLGIAVASLALVTVPQGGLRGDRLRFQAEHPALAPLVRLLGLDHVVESWWFLALIAIAAASLAAVQVQQWRRVIRGGAARLTPASFAAAVYRRELTCGREPPAARFERRGRAGLLGSPLFHLGLLLLVGAAAARALFGAEAVALLVEGETLAPRPDAWTAQWPRPLGRPLSLEAPLTLEELRSARYASGDLRSLQAVLRLGGPGGRRVELGVNQPLTVGAARLYLGGPHGPAALVTFDGETHAMLLEQPRSDGNCEATQLFGADLEVRLRGFIGADAKLPRELELRVLRRGGLLALGRIAPGRSLQLPGGHALSLDGIRYWGKLEASQDRARPLAFAGIALMALGALLLFAVVPVDRALIPLGGGKVLAAMRPHRFAPLFQEDFEAWTRSLEGRV